MRTIGYIRVSTTEQGDTHLGLDAQHATIAAECARRGWGPVCVVEEIASASSMRRRPLLRDVLDALDRGDADALVVAKLDRLARSTLDFARIMERAADAEWVLVILDIGADTSTPAGRMVASVVAATAAYERELIGARTRDALAAKRAQGARLGRPSSVPADTRARVVALRDAGLSLRAIADELVAEGVPTALGHGTWHAAQVSRVLGTIALDAEATARRHGDTPPRPSRRHRRRVRA